MNKVSKKMILGFAIGLGLLIALVVTLAILSPGKSMSEKLFVRIGGVEQGMFIRSENLAHSPIFEEPERFRLILEKDILKAEINFCDK